MEEVRSNKAHIWISIALFVTALFLPGYYIREWYEPVYSLHLLAMGWLGPLDGHISWYANVFFLISLLKCKDSTASFLWALLSFFLAVSFLAYDEVIVSEAPSYTKITAYGFGYMLWVASIGILSLGQFLDASKKHGKVYTYSIFAWLAVVSGVYLTHYAVGDDSRYSVATERDTTFSEKCKVSTQQIFGKAEKVHGVFYDPNWGVRYQNKGQKGWWSSGVGVLRNGIRSEGTISFYETRSRKNDNDSKQNRFTRHLPDNVRLSTDQLESDYAVVSKSFDIPKSLGIFGAEVTIRDLSNKKIIARTAYIFDRIERRFCGHAPKGYFSTGMFVNEVLGI